MGREEQPEPLQRLFLTAHPNPQRIGCPGAEVLRALARQRRPGDHPAEAHLGECSPCFKEYLDFRNVWQQRRKRTLELAITAAVVLLVMLAGFWWKQFRRLSIEIAPNTISRSPGSAPGVLNFQGSASRGTGQLGPKDQILSRSTRQLSIILPIGSDPGQYEIQIRPPSGSEKRVATFSGVASVDAEGIIALRTNVDFSSIPSGAYIVAWRHQGTEFWDVGPFVIR